MLAGIQKSIRIRNMKPLEGSVNVLYVSDIDERINLRDQNCICNVKC